MNELELRTPESVYLEWLNDFITVECMAEHYDIDADDLLVIIQQGKEDNKGINL